MKLILLAHQNDISKLLIYKLDRNIILQICYKNHLELKLMNWMCFLNKNIYNNKLGKSKSHQYIVKIILNQNQLIR